MNRTALLDRIRSEKVIALIRADSAGNLVDCARALAEGGLTCIELTMTTPGAIELCTLVSKELPQVVIGLGTVLDEDTARRGIAAGARFIVTPAVRPAVIAACRSADVPVFGGALTPTEILATWELGADVVKIFPAEFFGPSYLKSVRAPFPTIKLMPTGGVTPETVGEFLKNGAFATAAGSALVNPADMKAGRWEAISARAREFVAAAKAAG
jgi:2-dehydro-3-deoxyphosphogluconate aldolase/(4S)-4-hydroxy-2-oxoglutarate aldolase